MAVEKFYYCEIHSAYKCAFNYTKTQENFYFSRFLLRFKRRYDYIY